MLFTATGGYAGPVTIRYTVSDGRNAFGEAGIDVRVRPVATALPDSGFTVAEDTSLVIRVERLLSNDLDGDRMIIGQVYGAKNGTVALSSDGTISFTPAANFNGTAEFIYVANTPEGGRADAKVTIAVGAVNDAPVAVDNSGFVIAEGSAFDVDIDNRLYPVRSYAARFRHSRHLPQHRCRRKIWIEPAAGGGYKLARYRPGRIGIFCLQTFNIFFDAILQLLRRWTEIRTG